MWIRLSYDGQAAEPVQYRTYVRDKAELKEKMERLGIWPDSLNELEINGHPVYNIEGFFEEDGT